MHQKIAATILLINILLIYSAIYTCDNFGRYIAGIEAQAAQSKETQEYTYRLERTLAAIAETSRGQVRRTMEITAYTAGPESTGKYPGDPDYGVTASGRHLSDNDAWKVAAADPDYYPPGCRILVPGIGVVTVTDTGGDVKGPGRLDIFAGMTAVDEANVWGRKQVEVLILR